MRPARKGPENPVDMRAILLGPQAASMRPARKGPENRGHPRQNPKRCVMLQ